MSLTLEHFENLIVRSLGYVLSDVSDLAVGVSGGPDSMALLWLLQDWCSKQDKTLHVVSVNHGLRAEAYDECKLVQSYCERFDRVCHEVLVWEMPSDVRVQEEARKARYDLMRGYCESHDIKMLFLAHHQDDQAETVLFRLAKGSGLDGLSGMSVVQDFEGLVLCRPLLEVSKMDLVQFCKDKDIPFVDDPSNENASFARVRLRRSMDVLAEEGLTSKRLSVTAKRLARARNALDAMAIEALEKNTLNKNTDRIEFKKELLSNHSEIVLRVILQSIVMIGLDKYYSPRMEKVEDLVGALQNDHSFRKRTLGGVIFERDDSRGCLILMRENIDH